MIPKLENSPPIEDLLAKCRIEDIAIDTREMVDADKKNYAFIALKPMEMPKECRAQELYQRNQAENNIQAQNKPIALEKNDGNYYISKAFGLGATIVISDDVNLAEDYAADERFILVKSAREYLLKALDILYPKLPKKLIAVTGTNGKTSVSNYCMQIAQHLGFNATMLGTTGIKGAYADELAKFDHGLTTYDIVSFRKILHFLANHQVDLVTFEASSHGLLQGRLGNIQVDIAAFTSFSQDHLDYHLSMDKYLDAKMLLFTKHLKIDKEAVISSSKGNMHQVYARMLETKISLTVVDEDLAYKTEMQPNGKGQSISFVKDDENYDFETSVIGTYQAGNIIMAAELIHKALGVNFKKIVDILGKIIPVEGRLERLQGKFSEQIFIDFAHTADALEKSLIEMLHFKNQIEEESKIWLIFGCGGDRDATKRPEMAKIAQKYADICIITDDNPRTENAQSIRAQILASMQENENIYEISGREQAIIEAVERMKKNDILLIAGKGHEQYQIIGLTKHHFSDIEIASNAIKNKYKLR